jgi:2-C-methyl-D-erythritol 2,4-cyclodiphosphate synthase
VHKLAEGRPLRLGGVTVPHDKGAQGYSDADVLIHALCDALLGACGLRDIGHHFPDTEAKYKGIDSRELLKETMALLLAEGYRPGNADCTVALEKPKIGPFVAEMKRTLAGLMHLSENDIAIKATTNERLGYVGREEGVCAWAAVLVYKS